MPEHTVAERLRARLKPRDVDTVVDAAETGTPAPKKPKPKPKPKEKVGVGLNESNKTANKILVSLSAQIQRKLHAGAKPGSPGVENLRQRMLAINQTRIK